MLSKMSPKKKLSEQNSLEHQGNVCYTEDNVLVYNLYVCNIPGNVSEETLKKYFSRYGEVHSISIGKDGGFVNFKSPESAALALRTLQHTIQDKKIEIKAADSCKQPAKKVKNDSDNEDLSQKTLLDLNDDCLLHIFSFLTLREQLRMAYFCRRLESVFQMMMKRRKDLNINDVAERMYISLAHIEQRVLKYCKSVENVTFSGSELMFSGWERAITYVPQYCPNLKTLNLESFKMVVKSIRDLTKLKSINELELINCKICDRAVFYLSQLPELTSLDLTSNERLTGRYLNKLEKLQKLSLYNCYNVKESHILEFCKSLKSLKELHIEIFNKEILDILVRDMKNLEVLILTAHFDGCLYKVADIQNLKSLVLKLPEENEEDYLLLELIEKLAEKSTLKALCIQDGYLSSEILEIIPTIKSIKRIVLDVSCENDTEFLRRCAQCDDLQYLRIGSCGFENSDIVNLIKNSKSLKTLDLTDHGHTINEQNILEMVNALEQNPKSEPFELILSKNAINQNRLKNLLPSNVSEILTLTFEETGLFVSPLMESL